jgi:hypothetical protein
MWGAGAALRWRAVGSARGGLLADVPACEGWGIEVDGDGGDQGWCGAWIGARSGGARVLGRRAHAAPPSCHYRPAPAPRPGPPPHPLQGSRRDDLGGTA